jgi:hypothetical protein
MRENEGWANINIRRKREGENFELEIRMYERVHTRSGFERKGGVPDARRSAGSLQRAPARGRPTRQGRGMPLASRRRAEDGVDAARIELL